MQKKTIIILLTLSAVFSMFYILLSYYGFLRYISIHLYSTESYMNNYKNLDQINKQHKVVISIIACDEQLKNIKYVVKSLLDQTVKVNLISIITHDNNYVLPKELINTVAVYKCNKQKTRSGNLNSILSTIVREGDSTTKLITLEAGVVYGKDFIESLLEMEEKNPNCVVYVNKENYNYIELEKGVVFNMGFFDKDFIDIPTDVDGNKWVNTYINNKNIKKVKLDYNQNYKL